MLRVLVLFSLTFILSSCSLKAGKLKTAAVGSVRESLLPKGQAPQIILAPVEELAPLFEGASVTCEDANQCPESVGFVISKFNTEEESGIIQCTGFLIDSQTLLTNSHCVPTKLRVAGSDCSDVIEVLFAETPLQKSARARCATVLQAEAISESGEDGFRVQDYAVLKLERPVENRKPLEIARTGLRSDTSLTSYAVDPVSSTSPVGKLKSRQCMSMQGLHIVPEFNDDFAPIASVVGCELVQGNSGSPLLDKDNRVRGLLFAGADGDMIFDLFGVRPTEGEYVSVNAIVNSSCWDLPAPFVTKAGDCDRAREPIAALKLKQIPATELSSQFESWLPRSDARFLFARDRQTARQNRMLPEMPYEQPRIECIQSIGKWPTKETAATFDFTLDLPRWGYKVRFDQFTRPSFTVEEIGLFQNRFSIELAQFNEPVLPPIMISARDTMSFMSVTTLTETKLSYCR